MILSIREDHAERIFNRAKRFELRKVLPKAHPARVYLYQTGGVGIVGCFDVGEVLYRDVNALWHQVGPAGSSIERFFSYFGRAERGFALRVTSPVRFTTPVSVSQLREDYPPFKAPQNYLVVPRTHTLHALLERKRDEEIAGVEEEVTLRPILKREERDFKELVRKHIGAKYDEIDESFAAAALATHRLGHDPVGYFTTRKEVLAALNERGVTIGFTVLTYKSGATLKSGPTILKAPYRRRGLGQALRAAIERRARSHGVRKVYCTAPAGENVTVEYLLRAGMRVEAHLRRHYRATSDEFVFGKILTPDPASSIRPVVAPSRKGAIRRAPELARGELVRRFQEMFATFSDGVTKAYARRVVAECLAKQPVGYESKPKALVVAAAGATVVGAVTLQPKRGGAVKAILLRRTSHRETLGKLVDAAVEHASKTERRKIYFLVPVNDLAVTSALKEREFVTEGVLHAPYVRGIDVFVYSRFL